MPWRVCSAQGCLGAVGAEGVEHSGRLDGAGRGGVAQGRPAAQVHGQVRVRARLEEHAHRGRVPAAGRQRQRRPRRGWLEGVSKNNKFKIFSLRFKRFDFVQVD